MTLHICPELFEAVDRAKAWLALEPGATSLVLEAHGTYAAVDRDGRVVYAATEPEAQQWADTFGAEIARAKPARLGHCTLTFAGHSPACDRDGIYCSQVSSHAGDCTPHGSAR